MKSLVKRPQRRLLQLRRTDLGTQRLAVGCRNLLNSRTKGDVVRGTLKVPKFSKNRRAQSKCINGIRDRDLKQQLRLRIKGNVNEALRQTMVLEVVKRIGGPSVTIKK
jgi:hypothetical protein